MAKEQIVEQIRNDAAKAGIDPDIAVAVSAIEGQGPAFPGHGEPLAAPPAPQSAGPTQAQHDWLQKHPNYVRSSHHFGRMVIRGTLYADGSFIPEDRHPVMDGPDCFGIGVPVR